MSQAGLPYYKGGNETNTTQFNAFAGGAGSGAASDPLETARKLRQFTIDSNQPAIASLQSSIPETSARFETERTRLSGEKEPLKQRYQNLLSEVTRRESADIGAVQRRTGQEFGYRGIPASSTLYQDELIRAESPIRQAYAGQAKDVGLEQENSLRGIDNLIANMAGQETEAKRSIQNAIAQLQSGEPASAIQGALSLIGLQQQAAQQQSAQEIQRQQLALQEKELSLNSQPKLSDQYASLGEGSSLINLLTGRPVYTNPKTYKPEDGGSTNEATILQQIFGKSAGSSSGSRYSLVP